MFSYFSITTTLGNDKILSIDDPEVDQLDIVDKIDKLEDIEENFTNIKSNLN